MAQSIDLGRVLGQDGFSPQVTVAKSDGDVTVTVTDKNGVSTASLRDIETAADIPTGEDGVSVQDALDGLAMRTAADVPTDEEGVSVQKALDGLTTKTAANIATNADGVSVQDALDGKLASANVVNNLTTTTPGYALDARQGDILNNTKAQYTLLYTNASPTSSFPAQNIPLDLSQYTLFLFDIYIGPTSYGTTTIVVKQLKGRAGVVSYFFENGVQASRNISVSGSHIAFDSARQRSYNTEGTGWENNSLMIPYHIWGVKGV